MHLEECVQTSGSCSDRRISNSVDRHWPRPFVQHLTLATKLSPTGGHFNRTVFRHFHKLCICSLHAHLSTVGHRIYNTYQHIHYYWHTNWHQLRQTHGHLLWWQLTRSSICLRISHIYSGGKLSICGNLHYDQEEPNRRRNFYYSKLL